MIVLLSCSRENQSDDYPDSDISFAVKELTTKVGDTTIIPILSKLENSKFTIKINNTAIVKIIQKNSKFISLLAKYEGKIKISLYDQSNTIKDTCLINIGKKNTIKLLCLGNSFSEDAVENYLYELCKSNQQDLLIGNLFMGGASFTHHIDNLNNNLPVYSYRKISLDGKRVTLSNQTIQNTLKDEKWDIISFQQVSQNSGQYETFKQNLPLLYQLVIKNNPNPNTKYILHQTWAYGKNSSHPGFANYNKNQLEMYHAIVSTYQASYSLIPTYFIVPCGTAIQNGRTSPYLGDDLTRDGFHLSLGVGRFIAACTWYEKITNSNVIENKYFPATLSYQEALDCKRSAHLAVINPYKITFLN